MCSRQGSCQVFGPSVQAPKETLSAGLLIDIVQPTATASFPARSLGVVAKRGCCLTVLAHVMCRAVMESCQTPSDHPLTCRRPSISRVVLDGGCIWKSIIGLAELTLGGLGEIRFRRGQWVRCAGATKPVRHNTKPRLHQQCRKPPCQSAVIRGPSSFCFKSTWVPLGVAEFVASSRLPTTFLSLLLLSR